MRNNIYYKWFIESLRKDQKKDYDSYSTNEQNIWYISYLEDHYGTKFSKQETQLPNKVFLIDFTATVYIKARYHIIVAAKDEETAKMWVNKKIGLPERFKVIWLMNSWHETIYTRDGSEPEPIQAKILSNTNTVI